EALWADLASEDATKAYRASGALVAAPEQAVPFVRRKLPPVAEVDRKRLARLISELDDDTFAVRERARGELEKLGPLAAEALRRRLAGKPTVEQHRRVEALLRKPQGLTRNQEGLRTWRAIEVLEYLATKEARGVLETLAGGAAAPPATAEAKAALARLARR